MCGDGEMYREATAVVVDCECWATMVVGCLDVVRLGLNSDDDVGFEP